MGDVQGEEEKYQIYGMEKIIRACMFSIINLPKNLLKLLYKFVLLFIRSSLKQIDCGSGILPLLIL